MPTSTLTPIGERLRALADARDLSTYAIQRLTEIDQSSVSKIYAGKTSPTVETVGRILAALDCTWSDLDEPRTTNRGATR